MKNKTPKKKRPIGCLLIIIFFIILITTMVQQLGKETAQSQIKNQENILSLKDQTFSMYEDIYKINNNLNKGLEALINGNISSVDYYDFLKEIKKYSLNQINFLDQETNKIKDENILKNLEPYSSVYTKLLMVSDNMIKNLDNPDLEILSKTKKLVDEINILTIYIGDQRSTLLKSIGIKESEISDILKDEKEKIDLQTQ